MNGEHYAVHLDRFNGMLKVVRAGFDEKEIFIFIRTTLRLIKRIDRHQRCNIHVL